MSTLVERLKTYGSWGALFPLLLMATVTLPKFYRELVGTDIFGTRKIVQAEVLGTWQRYDETCMARLRLGESFQVSMIPCEDRPHLVVGSHVEKIDAWTVYISPEDAAGHAFLDAILLLIELSAMLFLLWMRPFVEWVEKQVRVSAPIFISPYNSQDET